MLQPLNHEQPPYLIYTLCFEHRRIEQMRTRFRGVGVDPDTVYFSAGVPWDDPRMQVGLSSHSDVKRAWSLCYGHLDMIRRYYDETAGLVDPPLGIFAEDDILLRRDFVPQMARVVRDFRAMKLDILLLGYLCSNPIDTYSNFRSMWSEFQNETCATVPPEPPCSPTPFGRGQFTDELRQDSRSESPVGRLRRPDSSVIVRCQRQRTARQLPPSGATQLLRCATEFTYLNYPEDTWGTQMYMISREHAGVLLAKYERGYLERTLVDPSNSRTSEARPSLSAVGDSGPNCALSPFSADWTLTKEGRRQGGRSCVIYPLMAIEDGLGVYDDPGQAQCHYNSHAFSYRPALFFRESEATAASDHTQQDSV